MEKDSKTIDLLSPHKYKSFFDIPQINRGSIKAIFESFASIESEEDIECYTFAINPVTRKALNESYDLYFMFIDTIECDYYFAIKKYLLDNKAKINSFHVNGASDMVITFYGDEHYRSKVREDLLDFIPRSKVGTAFPISTFRVSKYYIFWGKIYDEIKRVNHADFIKDPNKVSELESLHRNYLGFSLVGNLSEKEIANSLKKFEDQGLIINYFVITRTPRKFKVIIGLEITAPVLDEVIYKSEIKDNIISLFKVEPVRNDNDFFDGIKNIMICQFEDFEEYCSWKEKLYEKVIQIKHTVNVFAFDVVGKFSERPFSLGRRPEFEDLKNLYSTNEIIMGNPIYLSNSEDENVGLSKEALQGNGLICGVQGQGKTTTLLRLAGECFKMGLKVHIFDSTDDINPKLTDVKDENWIMENVENLIEKNNIDIDQFKNKIYCYFSSEEQIKTLTGIFLDSISKRKSKTDKRKIDSVFIFVEAHSIFESDSNLTKKLVKVLSISSRKKSSIWLSNQSLRQFPKLRSKDVLVEFRNKIFHKTEENVDEAVKLLPLSEGYKYLNSIEYSIKSLLPGECIVAFQGLIKNKTETLAPMQIKITKDLKVG